MKRNSLLLLCALALMATPALAQLEGTDTAPGESCSGFPAGAARVTADADQDGKNITLICDGTVWQSEDRDLVHIKDADGDTAIQVEKTTDDDTIRFDTAGAERVVIDPTGKVGIGTDAPVGQFEIAAPNGHYVRYGSGGILSGGFSTDERWSISSLNSQIQADQGFVVRDGPSGTGLYQQNLVLRGTTSSGSYIDFSDNRLSMNNIGNGGVQIVTNAGQALVADQFGNVGIGTTFPATSLHVAGSIKVGNGEETCASTIYGSIRYNSAEDVIQYCDANDSWVSFASSAGAAALIADETNADTRITVQAPEGTDTDTITLSTSGTERMVINASGSTGIGTTTPASSALLDLSATDRGFLPPRMTEAERGTIASPATGLIIFNTTANRAEIFDGSGWKSLGGPVGAVGDNLNIAYRNADFPISSSEGSTLFIVSAAALATLPALSSVDEGFRVYVKRTGFGNVTVAAASGDTIEGAPSMGIGFQGGLLEIVATAARWELLRAGTAGGGGTPSACPAGSVSYGTAQIGVSEFNITQAMVDHCIFSFEVKGAGGGSSGGGAGGGIAFNWIPQTVGKLGIFVGEGGFYNSQGAPGGLGGGGYGDIGGAGGASAVRFFEIDNGGAEVPNSSVVLAIAGGGGGSGISVNSAKGGKGGSIGGGQGGQGERPGSGAPGDGSGGVAASTAAGSGGSAGNNGGSPGNYPIAVGVPAFNIGGGGAGYFGDGGGGGGGYGGGGGGLRSGGGGGAGFLLSDTSISNGTSITGGGPGILNPYKGEDGSVTIVITGR